MSNSCPVCDFISTKKYFHACLRAVCLETWCSHVPVLASQECQDFSPHLRPRLVVLNVAGTPWQVTSSFMPITPQWFHCGEGQEGPSLLPRGTDKKRGHAIVLRCLPYSWDLRAPGMSCALICSRFRSWARVGPSVNHQAPEQLHLIPEGFTEMPSSHNEDFKIQDSREK